jgi:nitric oxide reductase subunit B
VQVLLGAVTAHYTVEGQAFFGFPLANYLPYSLTRTWHIQTAMFWIATAFLAAGLFLAPVIGGAEPRFQRLGVNVLFGALLVVVGRWRGNYFAIHQKLTSNGRSGSGIRATSTSTSAAPGRSRCSPG